LRPLTFLVYNWGQFEGKFANFGDRLMLESTLFILSKIADMKGQKFLIYIPTTDKEFSEYVFKKYLFKRDLLTNLEVVFFEYKHVKDLTNLYKICNNVDIKIIGGIGSLIQAKTSIWYHLFNFLPIIFNEKDDICKTVIWGVSMDKVEKLSKIEKSLILKYINKVDSVIVRDELSYNNTKTFLINKNKLRLDNDLSFYHPSINNLINLTSLDTSQNENILIIPRVVFETDKFKFLPRNLLPFYKKFLNLMVSDYLVTVKKIIEFLNPKKVCITPFGKFSQINDIEISKITYEFLNNKIEAIVTLNNIPLNTFNFLKKLKNCYDIIITSSFHGFLLSIIFGKDCYYIKTKENINDLGYYGKLQGYVTRYCWTRKIITSKFFKVLLLKRRQKSKIVPQSVYESEYYKYLSRIVEEILS